MRQPLLSLWKFTFDGWEVDNFQERRQILSRLPPDTSCDWTWSIYTISRNIFADHKKEALQVPLIPVLRHLHTLQVPRTLVTPRAVRTQLHNFFQPWFRSTRSFFLTQHSGNFSSLVTEKLWLKLMRKCCDSCWDEEEWRGIVRKGDKKFSPANVLPEVLSTRLKKMRNEITAYL